MSIPPGKQPAQLPSDDDGLPLPKWFLWIAIPGAIAPILIFGFIVLTETSHDEDKCPFRELSRRPGTAGTEVIEEGRRCIEHVEERRFVMQRGGERYVLGERRFAPDLFKSDVYAWEVKVNEQGETHVRVTQKGHGEVVFREGSDKERRRRADARE